MSNFILHADDFGRSNIISKNILNCVKHGNIKQVSVMVGFVNNDIHKKLLKTKIPTRLHLNLTDSKNFCLNKKNKKFSFFKILFASSIEKKIIINDINNQIKQYKKIYKNRKLRVDGHQHIHMIPWIYNYLYNNVKDLTEIRFSVEKINLIDIKYFFKYKFIRNIFATFLLKLFSFFCKKKTNKTFYGILYSDLYNKSILESQIKDNTKKKEILIHPGFTMLSERKKFNKKFFNYYFSKQRIKEYELSFLKKK